jgi:hypothetical protein
MNEERYIGAKFQSSRRGEHSSSTVARTQIWVRNRAHARLIAKSWSETFILSTSELAGLVEWYSYMHSRRYGELGTSIIIAPHEGLRQSGRNIPDLLSADLIPDLQ